MLLPGKLTSLVCKPYPSTVRAWLRCVALRQLQVPHYADCRRLVRQSLATDTLLLFIVILALGASGCTKEVVVPDVLHQEVDNAKKILEAVPLKTGNVTGVPESVPPGAYVVSQNPKASERVRANSSVDLVLEAPVSLPDLVRSNVTDAVNLLQGLGLKVALVKQPSTNILGGPKIVGQNPTANTMVHRDAAVTLTVAMPPNLATLVGLITREPAYENLKPEYRSMLDDFLK